MTTPVSVVIPYFEQAADLARLCAALDLQSWRDLEIVVADDGSQQAPSLPPRLACGTQTRLVRQENRGFRAGAARNLGVAAAGGDIVVFLDTDMVPEPLFVERLVGCVRRGPDVLAVGRRRHAQLTTWTPHRVRSWLTGSDAAPVPLREPAWLSEGYAATRNLAAADDRSYRFVISAVMACGRALFDDVGGFDERFVGYGGEDWDFAYRAFNNGATLVHQPAAVAWHNGPDWAGRADARAATIKSAEAARLAELIPEPSTRGGAGSPGIPDVLVDLVDSCDSEADLGGCVDALLAQSCRDLAVRVPPGMPTRLGAVLDRVSDRPWTTDQERRARTRITLNEAVRLQPGAVARLAALLAPPARGAVRVIGNGLVLVEAWSTRELGRRRRAMAKDSTSGAPQGLCDIVLSPRDVLIGTGSPAGALGG